MHQTVFTLLIKKAVKFLHVGIFLCPLILHDNFQEGAKFTRLYLLPNEAVVDTWLCCY